MIGYSRAFNELYGPKPIERNNKMNERIRELIEQADFEENDGHISIQGVYMFNTTRMEKFAELIVKECLTFVEPMPGSGDIDDLALEAAYKQIKEHFGVEE